MKPDFFVIPQVLVDDKNLSPADWIVYAIVYWFERMKDGRCTASNNKIAEAANLKSRTVRASLEKLETGKYVIREFKADDRKARLEIKTLVAFSRVGPFMPTLKTQGRLKHVKKVGSNEPQINKMIKERIQAPDSGAGKEVNDFIDLFKAVDPNHERLFKNRTQRAAAERLIKKHGWEKMKGTMDFLAASISKPFCPKITDPLTLERDMGKLIAFYHQEKGKVRPGKFAEI